MALESTYTQIWKARGLTKKSAGFFGHGSSRVNTYQQILPPPNT